MQESIKISGILYNMKKIFTKLIITFSIFIIVACASSGRNFDMNVIDSFIPGQTTLQEAIDKLGPPTARSQLSNGEFMLGWNYATASAVAGRSKSAYIQFSPDGKMKKVVNRMEINN